MKFGEFMAARRPKARLQRCSYCPMLAVVKCEVETCPMWLCFKCTRRGAGGYLCRTHIKTAKLVQFVGVHSTKFPQRGVAVPHVD
jgi:hypothetical protein